MKHYLVSMHGADIEEIDRYPEDWEKQYMNVFTNELEAYKYAYNELKKDYENSEAQSNNLIEEYRKKYFCMLWEFKPEKVSKLAPWHHKIIKEITNGEITL